MPWLTARPTPVPPGGLVVKKGSNTRARRFSGIPGPLSRRDADRLAGRVESGREAYAPRSRPVLKDLLRVDDEVQEHLMELSASARIGGMSLARSAPPRSAGTTVYAVM